jgi:beta-galactosidase
VHAEVCDSAGTLVPAAVATVRLTVEGDATIIGENPRIAEAGIASVLLRVGIKPGTIKVTAVAEGLSSATVPIRIGRPSAKEG